MKLLECKTFPKITLSVSGKILHMNIGAKIMFLTLNLGQSIFEIIDANIIRKLSMYKKRLEIVKIEEPSCLAALKVSGKSRTKTIEATFLPFDFVNSTATELYSDKNMPKSNTCVDISKTVSAVLSEMEKRKEHLCLNIEAQNLESSYVKLGAPQAALLVLSSIMILAEIDSVGKIEITTSKGILKASLEYNKPYIINSTFDLLAIYPQLYSNVLLLEAICEDEFISFGVRNANGRLSLNYTIPTGNKNELVVKRKTTTEQQRINTFIDTLSAKNEKTL